MENLAPIIFNSNIEFAIVGPLDFDEGIIIQSKNVGIDLIGIANRIYRYDREFLTWGIGLPILNKLGVNYIKSTQTIKTSGRREAHLIFCWRYENKESNASSFGNNNKKWLKNNHPDLMKFELDKFIENTYSILVDLVHGNEITELEENTLKWNISTILLQCIYPHYIK